MSNEEESKFIDGPPQYIGYAEIEADTLRQVGLRFEVLPYGDRWHSDVVDVSLSQTGPVTVTEYDGCIKRVFEIRRFLAEEYDRYPAIVTEYM